MEESYGYEEAMGLEKKKGAAYYTGKVLKFAIAALIIFIYGFFIVRLFISGDPSAVKKLVWNDVALDAYMADPEGFGMMRQEVREIFTEDGTFRVTEVRYNKDIGQLQTNVRYNNSTLKGLAEKYNLPEIPKGESFIYILKDANGVEYTDYTFKGLTKNVYNYRQLIFDGIDFETAGTLTLDIYYVGEVDKSGSPYATILIYDEDSYSEEFDFSKDAPTSITDGFSANPAYLVIGE